MSALVFFFNDTATTEIYTLSLHDALPIYAAGAQPLGEARGEGDVEPDPAQLLHAQKDLGGGPVHDQAALIHDDDAIEEGGDRKSTRLNSSHANISYAVFCLKKKKTPTAQC